MTNLSELKDIAQEYTILCVDDNTKLREQLTRLLKKFFKNVIFANDGQSGLDVYLAKRPDLIITDIEMPEMNGLEMTKQIKQIDKDVPIMIMSAYDEKEYLLDSIRYGVVNYLKKPVQSMELAEVLYDVLQAIQMRKDKDFLISYLQKAFDYQSNMIILLKDGIPVLGNPIMLEFFNTNSIEEFNAIHKDIGTNFLQHKNFLFSNEVSSWLDQVKLSPRKHFHVKMYDYTEEKNIHHFLLQYQDMPEKPGYALVLLDDITDLNLLSFFEQSDDSLESVANDQEKIFQTCKLLMEHNISIKIHNFYKGLSITNNTKIVDITDEDIILKTDAKQLRASEYENSIVISSDTLPHFILCREIKYVNHKTKTISASQPSFMRTSPTQRKNIRVEPFEHHEVSFEFNDNTYDDTITISDISIDAVKLKMIAKPIDLKVDDSIDLDMTLYNNNDQKMRIMTSAKVIRDTEHTTHHHVVVGYELNAKQKSALVDYIVKRQMHLIREFKNL